MFSSDSTELFSNFQNYKGCIGIPDDCLRAGESVKALREQFGLPTEKLPEVCANGLIKLCFYYQGTETATVISFPQRDEQP